MKQRRGRLVTKLKANCKGKAQCACSGGIKSRSFRVRLTPSETRRHNWMGQDILIVPVVMARADVVMNGSLFPEDEMLPETWDGVPVTVGQARAQSGHQGQQGPGQEEKRARRGRRSPPDRG
jgi:hypothetical protein